MKHDAHVCNPLLLKVHAKCHFLGKQFDTSFASHLRDFVTDHVTDRVMMARA